MTTQRSNFDTRFAELTAKTNEKMSRRELVSVCALLAYAAYHRNLSEDIISASLTNHFGVEDVTQLPSKAYDDVIKFLVDIQIDMILH